MLRLGVVPGERAAGVHDRLLPFEENLRTRKGAPRRRTPVLVGPDDRWARDAAECAAAAEAAREAGFVPVEGQWFGEDRRADRWATDTGWMP